MILGLSNTTAIVKSSICLSTVKVSYRFDILRNESALTVTSSEHQGSSDLTNLLHPVSEEVRHDDVTAGVKCVWNVITADKYSFL